MRDPNRIPAILSALSQYWQENPDMRLGQIISNVSAWERLDSDPFYMEDEVFLTGLMSHYGGVKNDDSSSSFDSGS